MRRNQNAVESLIIEEINLDEKIRARIVVRMSTEGDRGGKRVVASR